MDTMDDFGKSLTLQLLKYCEILRENLKGFFALLFIFFPVIVNGEVKVEDPSFEWQIALNILELLAQPWGWLKFWVINKF